MTYHPILSLFTTMNRDKTQIFPVTEHARCCRRDDTKNGSARFSRVVVPHPALGVPLRAALHYAAYSGWLSASAKSIHIHKLLITDSFAKTSSFCNKGIQLLSEESIIMPLHPGNCELQDNELFNATSTLEFMNKFNTTRDEAQPIDPLDNELLEDSPQQPFVLVDTYEWTGGENTGRAFGMTNTKTAPGGVVEIAEPVLRPRQRKTPRQRTDSSDGHEISEPLLRATQPPRTTTLLPIRKAKNYDMSTTPTYETNSVKTDKEQTGFVVQFLPSRLASFITRAERYARDTLLPLVSAYAPRLPIFGSREVPKPTARFIPTEDINTTSSVPIPTPTLEMKIESLRAVGPPGEKRSFESPEDPKFVMKSSTSTTTQATTTTTQETVEQKEKIKASPTEMLQIVPAPSVSTSTALPPVALRSKGEKIVIVYPSNARDERKIRSHSYPEELQFEALYQHAEKSDLIVDLPTFAPPSSTATPTSTSKPDGRYIPV